MQARRLRRRARIKPTMAQRLALAGCRCCPTTDPLWWAIIMLARWTDTLHQLSNTYLQSTTPVNADAEQVSFRCRSSALGAEPTSKQRRLSDTGSLVRLFANDSMFKQFTSIAL